MNELLQIINQSGLEKVEQDSIIDKFGSYEQVAGEWEQKARSIVVTNEDQTTEMAMAREARKKFSQLRIDVEKARKSMKEQSLRKGQAIDSIARYLTSLIAPIEDHLREQEDFVKIQAEKQAEKERIVAEEKAEAERVAKEKAEAEERERIRKENEQLRKEAEERERKMEQERKAAAEKQRIVEERARKEAEERERAEMLLRRKEEEEARIVAEEKAKKEAEAKREAESNDAGRLSIYADKLLTISPPQLTSEVAKQKYINAYRAIQNMKGDGE